MLSIADGLSDEEIGFEGNIMDPRNRKTAIKTAS